MMAEVFERSVARFWLEWGDVGMTNSEGAHLFTWFVAAAASIEQVHGSRAILDGHPVGGLTAPGPQVYCPTVRTGVCDESDLGFGSETGGRHHGVARQRA